MSLLLYNHPQSPPSQAVRMTLKQLGVEFSEKIINLMAGEQRGEDYLKVNPASKVPTLKDGDSILVESRAIAIYLCEKYESEGKENKLYPSDPLGKAKVNAAIFADLDIFFKVLTYANAWAVFYGDEIGPLEKHIQGVLDGLGKMETLLKNQKFLAAEHLTIADFFALNTIGFLEMVGFDRFSEFPRIQNWQTAMSELNSYSECHEEPFKLNGIVYRKKVEKNSEKK